MKKTILLAACLFSLGTSINAQEVIKPKKPMKPNAVEQTTNAEPVKEEHENNDHGKDGEHKMKTPAERAQQSVDGLNKRVALTEDQKPKIYSLAMDRVTKADAIRDKYKGTPENKATAKAELETVRKEYREQVKSILTAEQLTSLKDKAKQNHPKKGEGMGKGQGKQHGKGKGLDKPKEIKEKTETEESVDELID